MATVYYPQIECVLIDADGVRSAAASLTFDVYNITAAASEGTLASNSNGIIASGTLTADDGDIIEFTHATYPGVYRCVLKLSQMDAFTMQGRRGMTFIVENLQTPIASKRATFVAIDTDNPDAVPIVLGVGESGVTTEFGFQKGGVARNLEIFPIAEKADGSIAKTDYDLLSAESATVTIPALPGGTVTSVAMTVPSFLSIAGSPITSSGTLALSLANQSANTVFAGPTSGGAAAPAFRALVLADVASSVLGTGTANSTTYLRGDRTWQTISTGITIGTTPIASGNASRVLFHSASGDYVDESANLKFDGTNLVLGNGSKHLEIGLDASYNSIFGHAYAVGDNVNQFQFKYFRNTGGSFTGAHGLALVDTGNGFTTVIDQLASGTLYWTNAAGSPGKLLVGTWVNPGDSTQFVASSGRWIVEAGAFVVNKTTWGGNAQFEIRSTTEQIRVEYDASNYESTTISSTGVVTRNAVGSGAKFVFSDTVEVADGGIFGPMIADTASVYIDGPGGVYFDNDMTPRVALGDWNANGQGTQLIVDDNDQTISRNVGSGGEFAHIGGKLFQHFADETTTGTTQENLYTFTLPAGSLTQNGDTIKCEYSGTFTANTNVKRIFPKFGSTVLATGQVSTAGATDWTVDFYIMRVSNTVVRFGVEFIATGDAPTIESGEITGLNLTTTGYNIDLDGRTVTSAGELTAQTGFGIFYPAA